MHQVGIVPNRRTEATWEGEYSVSGKQTRTPEHGRANGEALIRCGSSSLVHIFYCVLGSMHTSKDVEDLLQVGVYQRKWETPIGLATGIHRAPE